MRDVPKTCLAPDCQNKMVSRGLCAQHYYRYKRDGIALPALLVVRRPACCTVANCSGTPHARGFCVTHYQRWLTHGDVQAERPKNISLIGVCTIDGCENSRNARGLCHMHYERKRLKGDVGPVHSTKGQGTLHDGYIRVAVNGKRRMKHRLIMEAHLGRALFPEETVHHRYGQRDDFSLKNLELWSSRHPSGQRVADKIDFCKTFLSDYGISIPTMDQSSLLSGAMGCV